MLRLIAVGQGLQKRDDIPLILRAHRRLISRLSVERRIGRIHIGAIPRRDIVELGDRPVRCARVNLLRLDVAKIVKIEYLLQRAIFAVVEENLAGGDIARRRGRKTSRNTASRC